MIRIGTLCYVVESCTASPATARAVGRIVEVCSAPYEAPNPWQYLPGTYYDVLFEGWTFYCHADKLRPISDPDADMGADETLPLPAELQSTASRNCGNTFDTLASR